MASTLLAMIERSITSELTRRRGSANSNLEKLHAKYAPAARVQRFVGLRPTLETWKQRDAMIYGLSFSIKSTMVFFFGSRRINFGAESPTTSIIKRSLLLVSASFSTTRPLLLFTTIPALSLPP